MMYRLSGSRMTGLPGTTPILLGLLLAAAVSGVAALKDVSVTIPLAVKTMDTVTLQCRYNLEGEPLYTVKWYKGGQEFFRYVPKELPNTLVFARPGLDVDLSKSSPHEVVLRNVQPQVTGRYKCEVSSDAPNFYTFASAGTMYVIDVPEDPPQIWFDRDLIQMGYGVRGNCTSPPAYPPANITWFLNGKKINESSLKHIPASIGILSDNRRHPLITESTLDLEIDGTMFEGGKAHFQCVASLFNLYHREDDYDIDEEKPKPRPSSELRTRDASGGCRTYHSLLLLFLVAMVTWR